MNEHDESAPRARNTRKSRALKRPSRWLGKRSGPLSSRPTAVPGEPRKWAPRPAVVATVVPAVPAAPEASDAAPPPPTFDDDAARFFSEGEPDPGSLHLEGDETTQDQGRRRAFSRHVLGVVALSVAVCIAAFVRSATGASEAAAAMPVPASASTSIAAVAVAELPRLAPAAAVAAPAPAETAAAPEVSPVAARAAREDARRALDRGASAAAIAAGAQSVELDPTDADAWLILGAAYQLAGKGAEARSAFYSCSKLAKRGNAGECRALVP